eukprot:CAMPEP_0116005004 /NCGR_PEP_ID=MMETSP0321-20121206/920_1 /TAXON_ID=163516 /ORGANISM="Leptocylindrus danicus var. danicus, Strain B650" /LENGTH=554 /DNA_ID=CAMNT_0003473375 /DNA_START=1314 /DNA_END=2978 /DNA_ORIENTATION=+
MITSQETDTMDIDILQREYRNMELNRKAFAEESNLVLRRQQQSLEKLRVENEALKTDIATLQTKSVLRPVASFEQKKINRIHTQMDKFATQIEIERNRIALMEEQIESLRDRIWGQRRSMGGVNAARENQRLVEKQVRILENRLDQALVKYNKSVAQNKIIRGEIDDLRGERLAFENVYKKLEKELQEKKKQMAHVIEISNVAYEQRDRAQSEISAINTLNRKEKELFEEQIVELSRVLEEDLKAMALKQAEAHARDTATAEEKKPIGKRSSKSNTTSQDRAMLELSKERVQNFEEAFRKIAAATGIADVDDLVQAFIANEEQNFSLFTYANEQANEIDRLEDQKQLLLNEKMSFEQQTGKNEDLYETILHDLSGKLAISDKQADLLDEKCGELTTFLDGLKAGIKSMLQSLECKHGESEALHVTETNMLYFLGIIEERTNEILSTYHKMKSKSRLNETLDTSHVSSSSNILGAGPTTPMDKDPIFVNPPKIADCSSDDDSIDDDDLARPLTVEELKNRSVAKVHHQHQSPENKRSRRRQSVIAKRTGWVPTAI